MVHSDRTNHVYLNPRQWVPVIKKAWQRFYVKAHFLIAFLNILRWRLNFLAGELTTATLSFLRGKGEGWVLFIFTLKHIQSKFLRTPARTLRNVYDLRLPLQGCYLITFSRTIVRLTFVLDSWDLLKAGWNLHGCTPGVVCGTDPESGRMRFA